MKTYGRDCGWVDVDFAGHYAGGLWQELAKIVIHGCAQTLAACMIGDRDTVNVTEVVVVGAKPPIILALVVDSGPQTDEEGTESALMHCDTKIARLFGKPAQFFKRNAVHGGDNRFVKNESFFEVLVAHVTYDCRHRVSVGVLAGARKTIDLKENFE